MQRTAAEDYCFSCAPLVAGAKSFCAVGNANNEACARSRCKIHDVIMEGIDLVLAKYGFPSLAEFKKGTR